MKQLAILLYLTVISQVASAQLGMATADQVSAECTRGEAQSCLRLGLSYILGRDGLVKDDNKAADLFKQSCEGGIAAGCEMLGTAHFQGRGVNLDKLRALELYQKACYGGRASACRFVGWMYHTGNGV